VLNWTFAILTLQITNGASGDINSL
jgi:hypothetical protein